MRIQYQQYFLFPVKGFVADLKAVDSKGTELVILTDAEFKELTGTEMETVRHKHLNDLKSKLSKELAQKYPEFIDRYRVIPILFSSDSDNNYYDEITLTWVERFENRKIRHISEYVEIPIFQPKNGMEDQDESSLYLSIKTSEKYRIEDSPEITNLLKEKFEYQTVLDDPRHKTYRFGSNFFLQIITAKFRIDAPQIIRVWAIIGLIATVVIPTIILTMFFYFKSVPDFSFETLLGTIGFIVGLRAIVFHDVSLMRNWNWTHLIGVLGCIVVLFLLMYWQQEITNSAGMWEPVELLKYPMVHR